MYKNFEVFLLGSNFTLDMHKTLSAIPLCLSPALQTLFWLLRTISKISLGSFHSETTPLSVITPFSLFILRPSDNTIYTHPIISSVINCTECSTQNLSENVKIFFNSVSPDPAKNFKCVFAAVQ